MTKEQATREALRMALEALKECRRDPRLKYEHPTYDKTITAIKEALSSPNGEAQPEQRNASEHLEPVAWVCHGVNGEHDVDFYQDEIDALPVGTMLYTSPPQRTWVGLTDEDWDYLNKYCGSTRSAIQTAETLLKEKNTYDR